jgi:hypothetical protein
VLRINRFDYSVDFEMSILEAQRIQMVAGFTGTNTK